MQQQIALSSQHIMRPGNLDERHNEDNEVDPFRWFMASYNTLKAMNAERVRVDELGRLWRVKPEEAARRL